MEEPDQPGKTLLILGLGPKGLAIAAKRAALRYADFRVPDLIFVDRHGVGAHWDGSNGYTDGEGELGTAPEKDLGFPYPSLAFYHRDAECLGSDFAPNAGDAGELSRWMFQQFSFASFLVDTTGHGDYVDADRPHPTHAEWSAYLRWAWNRILRIEDSYRREGDSWVVGGADSRLGGLAWTIGEIGPGGISMTENRRRWRVAVRSSDVAPPSDPSVHEADGLVITGPGSPRALKGLRAEHQNVFNGQSIWSEAGKVAIRRMGDLKKIVVIGTGETTAAVLVMLQHTLNLVRDVDPRAHVTIISPSGMLHSRGEGYWENAVFTNPGPWWIEWPRANREAFVRRSDRGVLSPTALKKISVGRSRVEVVQGHVERILPPQTHQQVLEVRQGRSSLQRFSANLVIDCRGFDPWSFRDLLDESTLAYLANQVIDPRTVDFDSTPGQADLINAQESIQDDLSILPQPTFGTNSGPYLHVPMLANVKQGPGFANLSCLGILSDRILSTYAYGPLDPPRRVTNPV